MADSAGTVATPLPRAGATNRSAGLSPLAAEVTGLFDQYRAPLLRYLYSFGITPHDGEEVVQEVFLALFQHLSAGRPRINLKGWIFRVGHNLALKRCQENRRVARGDSVGADRCDPGLDPEQLVSAQQRRARLLNVVASLPELDRRCLYLRAEGLRYREIADVLGISLGGVAQSLERSLRKLSRADGRN